MNTTTLLQNNVVFRVDVSLWTGKAKLSRADLPPDANIPPEDLTILGQKRLIDPDSLKPFTALKTRTIRTMNRYGAKFLSGWLVNEKYVDELDSLLSEIQADYYAAKDRFITAYHDNVSTWIDDHPEWREMLASVVPSEFEMRKKFGMYWQVYRVQPVDTKGGSMDIEVANIVNGDVKKMTDEMRSIYDRLFADRTTTITSKTLGALHEFAEWCHNLEGIYPSATYMHEAVKDILAKTRTPIDPASVQYGQLRAAIRTLSDADYMSVCIADWMHSGSDNMMQDVLNITGRAQMEPDELVPMTERRVPEPVEPVTVGTEELVLQQDTNQRTLSAMMDDLF